ncbi:hypothetical protein ACWDZ8_26830 [Streptomyces sp. NPDC003233]
MDAKVRWTACDGSTRGGRTLVSTGWKAGSTETFTDMATVCCTP